MFSGVFSGLPTGALNGFLAWPRHEAPVGEVHQTVTISSLEIMIYPNLVDHEFLGW